MNQIFEIHDEVEGYGTVSNVSERFVWFRETKQRVSKAKLKNIKRKSQYSSVPSNIDWGDYTSVSEFVDSFKHLSNRIRVGDRKTYELLKIQNGLVYYNGEYYLNTVQDCAKIDSDYVFGFTHKVPSRFGDKTSPPINLFYYVTKVNNQDIEEQKIKEDNFKNLSTVDYLKSLNLNRVNNKDLRLFKDNIHLLFDGVKFPYIFESEKNVLFKIDNFWGKPEIQVLHRNRTGVIRINNSYHGQMPYENNYGVYVEVSPNFTNVASVTVSTRANKFDSGLLNALATQIIKKWDDAIEKNYRIYG